MEFVRRVNIQSETIKRQICIFKGRKRTRGLEIFRDKIDFDNEESDDAILEYLNPNSAQYC